MADGLQSRRAAYVAALRRERAAVASVASPNELRLASIDEELAQYGDEPERASIEKAVPGPITKSRTRNQ